MITRLDQSIRRGRQMAESLMVDECNIVRPGPSTFNPSTGLLATTETNVALHVPCRVRVPTTNEMTTTFGEEQITLGRYVVCVPFDSVDQVAVNDIVVMTRSDELDGRRLRVLATPTGTHSLYRALPCELAE